MIVTVVDMTGSSSTNVRPGLTLPDLVAFASGGVVNLDWSNPAAPVMLAIRDAAGAATATASANGRVYVADGAGGLVVFK